MALERRVVSINFVGGLDQKTDKKLTTKLTTADNVILRKNGTIEKRYGFVANGAWSVSANPVKIFSFRDSEAVATDWTTDNIDIFTDGSGGTYVSKIQHVLNNVNNSWNTANSVVESVYNSCSVRTKSILADSGSVTAVEAALIGVSATNTGTAVYNIFSPSSSLTSVYASNLDTDAKKSNPFSLGFFSQARVISVSSSSTVATIFSFQTSASNTEMVIATFDGVSLANSIVASVVGSETTNRQIDAVSFNNKIYFATKQTSTTGIIIGSFDPATNVCVTTVIAASTTPNILTIATPAAGTDRIRLFWMRNTVSNTAFYASYSATLSQILAPTSFTVGVPGYGPGLITQLGAVENTGATTCSLFFTQSSTTGLPQYTACNGVHSNTATIFVPGAGSITAEGGFKSCSLAAKPFLTHGIPHVIVNHSATGQQSFVIAKLWSDRMVPVARCLYGLAGPNASSSYGLLPQVAKADEDTFYATLRRAVYFKGLSGSITANYGAELIRMNFSQTQPIKSVAAAGSTYMPGGFLSHYDSLGVIDGGFLSSAVIASVSTTTTGGSAGAATGSYGVVILKEFTDQAGRTHRGQPSLPVTFTTSTTTSQATVVFSDGPNVKGMSQRRGQIKYSVFRTTNGGTIYYRDSGTSFTALVAPPSITAFALSVTISDSSLSGSDVLYTVGGSLPHWTPDSCESLWMHGNRLWCEDPTDDTILRFSNAIAEGEGVAFAQSNIVRMPGFGRITAGASLDSNNIIFRQRSAYISSGNGPDDTGLNGSFSDGQILFQDIGCINQRNMCRFRDGIVFKSPDKGFYMLSRDLQLTYVGQDVEDLNSKTVVSSEVVGLAEAAGTAEECRFLCSDGTLLTYNYYNGQWTTATLAGCIDAVQTGGRYVVVNPTSTAANARVFQQSMSTYTDAFSNTSVTYQMTVETGWVKTADVQGFQRIWNVSLLGESQGPGNISVEVGYDYETAYNEAHTATMSSLTAPNYTGGAASIPQCNFVPVRQKCQAIRFRIKDYPTASGVVMKLTNLSLECGVKTGTFKLPASKGI